MAHPVVRAMEPSTVYRIAISQIVSVYLSKVGASR